MYVMYGMDTLCLLRESCSYILLFPIRISRVFCRTKKEKKRKKENPSDQTY